jgi:hypothetical protein
MNQSNNNSRRDFLRQSAVLGAGAVLAGSSNLFAEKSSGYGNGPYPTEGMAGYAETSPLQYCPEDDYGSSPNALEGKGLEVILVFFDLKSDWPRRGCRGRGPWV